MIRILTILVACSLCASFASAEDGGGLDGFLRNLNVEARANPDGFSATLSTQFNVSGTEVQVVLGAVDDPADAFMILQLGQMSNRSADAVMSVYKNHSSKGWGAIAQKLGIKPGSAEFHALKRGDLRFGSAPASHDNGGPGRGKGKRGR